MMSAAAMTIAAARNMNAACGDTALHSSPATAEAIRFPPAWTVASSPNADPRNRSGARQATAALCAVSPQPIPSPASSGRTVTRTGCRSRRYRDDHNDTGPGGC